MVDEYANKRLATRLEVIDYLQKITSSEDPTIKELGAESLTYIAGEQVQGRLSLQCFCSTIIPKALSEYTECKLANTTVLIPTHGRLF